VTNSKLSWQRVLRDLGLGALLILGLNTPMVANASRLDSSELMNLLQSAGLGLAGYLAYLKSQKVKDDAE